MVDEDTITRRLVYLDEYIRDLTDIKDKLSWEEFERDKIIKRYVERTFHLVIETCLDLGNHIISYEGYREPLDNRDSFKVLQEAALIGPDLAEKLGKMAQFRNVIVHDYTKIDPAIVYDILQKNIIDILDFAEAIKNKYL